MHGSASLPVGLEHDPRSAPSPLLGGIFHSDARLVGKQVQWQTHQVKWLTAGGRGRNDGDDSKISQWGLQQGPSGGRGRRLIKPLQQNKFNLFAYASYPSGSWVLCALRGSSDLSKLPWSCCSWSSMLILIILSWCCKVFRLSLFLEPEALFFSFSKDFISGVMQGLLLEKHHLVWWVCSVSHVVNVLPMGITEDQSFKASSVSSEHFFPMWFTTGCLCTSSLYTGWRRAKLWLILPSGGSGCDDMVSERCHILSTAMKQDPPICTVKWKFSDNSTTH